MNKYNTLNVKFSNSKFNKLKPGIKNGIKVTLNLSSNVVGDSNDEINFPHKLLLTNTQISRIYKESFCNGSSANIKFSKTQLCKMLQFEGFLRRLLGPLLKTGLSLIGNVLKPRAKTILVPLGLTAAASATDAAIQKKILKLGTATLVFSNEYLNDIIKIVKSLEDAGLLIKGVSETVENELKENKVEFLGMFAALLGASLSSSILTGKGVIQAGEGTIRAGEGKIRAGQDF